MNIRLIIALFILLLAIPAQGQRRRAQKAQRVKKISPEEQARLEKMERLKSAMQKVMIIDSMVVDKQDFLASYMLTSDAGTINNYNKFFNSEEQPYSTVYVNQLGNKCWFANNGSLYTIDKLNNQWSEPAPLEGLGPFGVGIFSIVEVAGGIGLLL